MKRVIRNIKTANFLTPEGAWSPDFASAAGFPSLGSANLAAHSRSLKDVEIVLVVGDGPDPAYDGVLAVLRPDCGIS